MTYNPDDKIGDDYPGDRTQPLQLIPGMAQKQIKKIFGFVDDDREGEEPPSNPHRQEPNNKPS